TVSDSQVVDTFVQTASENKVLSPLARAEAAFLAIQSALHHGNFQRIESPYSILAYLRTWRITEDAFPMDAPAARWKEFATGPMPWIEIGPDLWPGNRYITLETTIEAAQEQPAVFRFSSDTPATVYLNTSAVLEVPAAPAISFDQYTAAIQLRKG